jgi:hypothetical protein
MKSCPFEENREFLVMYHDGVMPEELCESYSEHLLTCKPCMQALLDLRNDLFSMENARFVAVPGELGALAEEDAAGKMASARKAVFRFIRGVLHLVENPPESGAFTLQVVPEFLGRRVGGVYQREAQDFLLSLLQEEEHRFGIVIQGLAGRSFTLVRDGRVIEGHTPVQEDHLVLGDLGCGDYELHVDDEVIILFRVDQEEVDGSEAGF